MNFCENCNFMLYKKLSGGESCEEGIPDDSGVCDLLEYCKNCGYEKKITDDNISVYKRNYKNNFVIDNILNNKYIVYDNTLPRLSIDCKNDNCITHNKFNHLSDKNSFLINNIPENIEDSDINDILSEFTYPDSYKEVLPDIKDYVHTVKGLRIHYKRIRLSEVIVYYSNIEDPNLSLEKNVKLLDTINLEFKIYLEDLAMEDRFKQKESLSVEPYQTIDKEVMYVKYDPENMKYIYICVNCGTSW
uniref:TFIIS-type domain-containing protein n=1 Tax=viral metagenome TaxID=1070528 RepID=A0A6C0B3S3_9ZZZZ